jgi:single-strand DNA-binding protein
MNFNQVTLVGRAGKDPEVKAIPSGQMVGSFSLAVSETWKGKDGKQQERTDWVKIEAWGKLAELIGQYVKKGSEVLVTGRLRIEEAEKDGQKVFYTKVVADNVVFGQRPKGEEKAEKVDPDALPF